MVVVNNWPLPKRLLRAIRRFRLTLRCGYRYLHGGHACFHGEFLLYDLSGIERETEAVIRAIQQNVEFFMGDPAKPLDSARIVCIGDSGTDCPVCLEYFDAAEKPRIIWLNDNFRWIEVAPDIDQFFRSFWMRGYF